MSVTQDYRPLEISTGLGKDVLLLTSFSGVEEFSGLFHYEIECRSSDDDIDPRQIIGKNATIRLSMGEQDRYINGYIKGLTHSDSSDRFSTYRATMVPWLWFLTQTADCRIFQEKSVPKIIEEVFKDLGFSDYQMSLSGGYETREYCVQYRETDFNFVSRLMEEEGIFYFFKHENGSHKMLVSDSPTAYFDVTEADAIFPDANLINTHESQVLEWQRDYSYHSGKFAHTDYNYLTPDRSLVADQSGNADYSNIKNFEVFDYHGTHMDKGRGKELAKIRVQEIEATRDLGRGASTYSSFTTGGRFRFSEHRTQSEIGNEYVMIRVQTSASLSNYTSSSDGETFSFRNRFECVPSKTPFRPRRTARKSVVEGPQTAVVVGPSGEEIYVDEHGRVKVQFFWDRYGEHDENSSCWIRVAQPWAGVGFGGMNIPRIGQEVIVDFLEGDPDRPIINGRVYNALSMPYSSNSGREVDGVDGNPTYPGNNPPQNIPEAAMMTSLRSNSLGGTGGYNEITMNDEEDKEVLFLKAQKDEVHIVGNDREDSVGNDENRNVGNDRTRKVGNDENVTIENNQELLVNSNRTVEVAKDHEETVGKNQTVKIGVDQSTSIGKNQSTEISMNEEINVGASREEQIALNSKTVVGMKSELSAGTEITINAGMKVTIMAGAQLNLQCGASMISMNPAMVTIQAPLVKLNC